MGIKSGLAFSTCVVALCAGGQAFAQTTADTQAAASTESSAAQNGANTGDIVVTARRRAESLSNVPIAVTAFSDAQIETKNIQNVSDLTKLTPGLNITGGGSRDNVFVTIRGQSRGVTGNVSPGVLTYFNEVPLPTYGSLIPTFDMENIQVLKGPQGTLFGRNSIGGAILTYSKAPTYDFGGYIEGELGQYNRRRLEGAVNLPIIADKVALRIAAQRDYSTNYSKTLLYGKYTLDPATGNAIPPVLTPSSHNLDQFRSTSFRASLIIEPTDFIKNVTVYDYTKNRGASAPSFNTFFPSGVPGVAGPALYLLPPATLLAALGPTLGGNIIRLAQCGTSPVCDYKLFQQQANTDGRYTNYINADPWLSSTKIWGVSNTTTITLSDQFTFKNIFGYRTNDSKNVGDNDGTPMNIIDTNNRIQTKIMTEEVQLSGSLFQDKLKFTTGAFYFKQSPNGPAGTQSLEVNAYFGLSHTAGFSYFKDTSKAVYGQVDYSLDWLAQGLGITAGYRYTKDTSGACVAQEVFPYTTTGSVQGTAANPYPGEAACRSGNLGPTLATATTTAILGPKTFKKGTYNLSLNWQVTPDALFYAAARRGYRAGSYNSPLYDAFLQSVQTFQPETLDDVELGTKLRWRGNGMNGSLDLAVYRGVDKNVQLPFTTSQLIGAGIGCVPEAANTPGSTAPLCTTASGQPGRRVPVPAATTYVNAGKSVIQGFEAAATLSPTEGLVLSGGVSLVDFKAKSVTNDPALAAVFRANGRFNPVFRLRQQPKWTVNAGLYYEYPDSVLDGKLVFNTDVRYNSRYLEQDFFLTKRLTVDANIGIRGIAGSGLDVMIVGSNIFNRKYDYGSFGSSAGNGYFSSLYGPPRVLSVQMRYKFGQ